MSQNANLVVEFSESASGWSLEADGFHVYTQVSDPYDVVRLYVPEKHRFVVESGNILLEMDHDGQFYQGPRTLKTETLEKTATFANDVSITLGHADSAFSCYNSLATLTSGAFKIDEVHTPLVLEDGSLGSFDGKTGRQISYTKVGALVTFSEVFSGRFSYTETRSFFELRVRVLSLRATSHLDENLALVARSVITDSSQFINDYMSDFVENSVNSDLHLYVASKDKDVIDSATLTTTLSTSSSGSSASSASGDDDAIDTRANLSTSDLNEYRISVNLTTLFSNSTLSQAGSYVSINGQGSLGGRCFITQNGASKLSCNCRCASYYLEDVETATANAGIPQDVIASEIPLHPVGYLSTSPGMYYFYSYTKIPIGKMFASAADVSDSSSSECSEALEGNSGNGSGSSSQFLGIVTAKLLWYMNCDTRVLNSKLLGIAGSIKTDITERTTPVPLSLHQVDPGATGWITYWNSPTDGHSLRPSSASNLFAAVVMEADEYQKNVAQEQVNMIRQNLKYTSKAYQSKDVFQNLDANSYFCVLLPCRHGSNVISGGGAASTAPYYADSIKIEYEQETTNVEGNVPTYSSSAASLSSQDSSKLKAAYTADLAYGHGAGSFFIRAGLASEILRPSKIKTASQVSVSLSCTSAPSAVTAVSCSVMPSRCKVDVFSSAMASASVSFEGSGDYSSSVESDSAPSGGASATASGASISYITSISSDSTLLSLGEATLSASAGSIASITWLRGTPPIRPQVVKASGYANLYGGVVSGVASVLDPEADASTNKLVNYSSIANSSLSTTSTEKTSSGYTLDTSFPAYDTYSLE